jgi:AcrR family transcriptional regulator
MSETAPVLGAKAAQSAQTRKRLIDAASELFAEQGYAGTSILQIAERSGISRGSVAWHFSSMTKLDRLARSVPDARDLVDELTESAPQVLRDPRQPLTKEGE